jgi:hypothetical protein
MTGGHLGSPPRATSAGSVRITPADSTATFYSTPTLPEIVDLQALDGFAAKLPAGVLRGHSSRPTECCNAAQSATRWSFARSCSARRPTRPRARRSKRCASPIRRRRRKWIDRTGPMAFPQPSKRRTTCPAPTSEARYTGPSNPPSPYLRDSPGIAPVKTTPRATPRPTVEPVGGLKRPIDARNPVTCPPRVILAADCSVKSIGGANV